MHTITKYFTKVLDLLFPQNPKIAELEMLSPAELYARIPKPCVIADSLSISALFDYKNDTTRELIHQLKYHGNRKIAALLAGRLYKELVSEIAAYRGTEKPIIVPMPISKKRRKERGYNQCELVLEELEKLDIGKNFEITFTLLEKYRHTVQQTASKTRKERIENLKDCFRVTDVSLLSSRVVFLLDDVTTTGTTLSHARDVLLAAGAKKVICVALAH